MSNDPSVNVSLKQARRLLNAITDLARESSLTGSLGGGAKLGIRQYNSLLDRFVEQGVVPRDLFVRLDLEGDSFDELGVSCALLNAYIDDDDPPPAPTAPSSSVVVHSDSQELRELRELGEILRVRLAERM